MRLLLWQASQVIESDVSLPEDRSTGKNLHILPKGHLWGQEGRIIELPWGPRTQTTDNPPKPRTTSFFPLRKLKANQPLLKKLAVHLPHLEEEDAGNDEDQESDNPSRIKGVTEDFMVCLERAVKDAQADEKCCYHCSSLEHFIQNCPIVKTSREKKQLKGKEGTASMKGAWTPLTTTNAMKSPIWRLLRHKTHSTDSLLPSWIHTPFSNEMGLKT